MIHPGRTTLNELLLTARDPRFVVRWLRKEPIGATLRAMAAGELPISHSTLDALPPSLRVRYLRHMLISAGTLPAVDVRLNDLENHAADFIADPPKSTVPSPASSCTGRRFARSDTATQRELRPLGSTTLALPSRARSRASFSGSRRRDFPVLAGPGFR